MCAGDGVEVADGGDLTATGWSSIIEIGCAWEGAKLANITGITVKNFKGINEITLKFGAKGAPPVTTLIGLNESGKTTILEALSHFVTGDNAVSSLFEGVHSKAEIASLIPVNKKSNFSGEISISANIELDDNDFKRCNDVAKEIGYQIEQSTFPKKIAVSRIYKFLDSAHQRTRNIWSMEIKARKGKAKIYKSYSAPRIGDAPDVWAQVIKTIQESLPRIAYFPTFLVDMPKKIYLSGHTNETAINKYYRVVFQDILDSLDEDLSLQKHVVDRIMAYKEECDNPNWFSIFWGSQSKAPIDSVFSKISSAVTKQVLGSWQKVFQRKISAKSILVEWGVDTEKGDLPYATFSIFDGESRYLISDRSLGFRWFFSFLLFTAFKQKQKRPTLFLFDEPAANLHAKAQSELLKSFSRTVSGGDGIVYSTHSHHMINPNWISGAQIVENTALDYDSDEDTFGLNAKPTNVVVTPYRHFVAQYPGRTSYFQPVIDMLEYVTPEIVGKQPFVLVEGITDFYALKLASRLSRRKISFSLMPGVGCGAAGPQIGLLLGRAERFVVLLDDDKAGRTSAKKYRGDWFLAEEQVFTLAKLGPAYEGKCLEGLISQQTRSKITSHASLKSAPDKKQIGLYLAEMCASNVGVDCISNDTLKELVKVLDLLELGLTSDA